MLISNKKLFTLNQTQKRRIGKNIFSGLSSEGLQIVTQIFFAPLMLIFWGIENFGIWIFLVSIPSTFLIFNVNTLDASIQEITMFKSNKKPKIVTIADYAMGLLDCVVKKLQKYQMQDFEDRTVIIEINSINGINFNIDRKTKIQIIEIGYNTTKKYFKNNYINDNNSLSETITKTL